VLRTYKANNYTGYPAITPSSFPHASICCCPTLFAVIDYQLSFSCHFSNAVKHLLLVLMMQLLIEPSSPSSAVLVLGCSFLWRWPFIVAVDAYWSW
jgi:hypothetical protein